MHLSKDHKLAGLKLRRSKSPMVQ